MSPRIYLSIVACVIVVGIGVGVWYSGKEARDREAQNRLANEILREIDDRDRAARRREYEEATRGPCGERVEMLDSNGDVSMVCERDVAYAESRGLIRRRKAQGQGARNEHTLALAAGALAEAMCQCSDLTCAEAADRAATKWLLVNRNTVHALPDEDAQRIEAAWQRLDDCAMSRGYGLIGTPAGSLQGYASRICACNTADCSRAEASKLKEWGRLFDYDLLNAERTIPTDPRVARAIDEIWECAQKHRVVVFR